MYPISREIWEKKYRLKDEHGNPVDTTVKDTHLRVASALAAKEPDFDHWKEIFFNVLSNFKFIPAGRIIAGAGTSRTVTLYNCFVSGVIHDSMEGIFQAAKEAALTLKQGGGIGYDFSPLRPRNAWIAGVGAGSSGPVSFMDVYDTMCKTTRSAGNRRGAQLATLRVDHPDILEYIKSKRDPLKLRQFNLSVGITTAFMDAVIQDTDFNLQFNGVVHKTVRAREIWDEIMRSTYEFAEPGVLFIDRINEQNNLYYCEEIFSTNPCLSGDTLVTTREGVFSAESLVGREVEIWDGKSWTKTEFRVTGENQQLLQIHLSNNSILEVTPYHTMILDTGIRINASELVPGDHLKICRELSAQSKVEVKKVSVGRVASKVYCCTVPTTHSFALANGVLVGNCGEQPLPPYGACLLGSINLVPFVLNPFERDNRIDFINLKHVTRVAVRMLDNVIDLSNYPLPQQKEEAHNKRRMGIGITGLADALIMLGKVYGEQEALIVTEQIMRTIHHEAYHASAELAKERGPFPLFKNDYVKGEHIVASLPAGYIEHIKEYGIRNSHLTSIAPTGTISLFADNVSSGAEPLFATEYERKITEDDGSRSAQIVEAYSVRKYREIFGDTVPRPAHLFVTAQTLDSEAHLKMQSVLQKYVDSSISKTINLPEGIPFEEFKSVYLRAYELGCKGCTTYRPNPVTGSILSVAENKPEVKTEIQPASAESIKPMRPQELNGKTYKLKWPSLECSLYITINNKDGKPYELFFNSRHMESYPWTIALGLMVSAVWRKGGDSSFVSEELKGIFDPNGGGWMDGRYYPSIISAIGHIIESHIKDLSGEKMEAKAPSTGMPCPKCGDRSLIKQEGCEKCTSCGYAKCG